MTEKDRFSSYQYGEAITGIGQAVEFTCALDSAEQVREFLEANVRTISIPTTGQVSVAHGGYGNYTRYDIVQHDYAGGGSPGGGGYIEILEIENPPDGRWGIVIHEYTSYKGSVFTEWETVENARAAYARCWGSHDAAEGFPKLPGFKRRVVCGALTPWFYAVGTEQLHGDYTFPKGLEDDAVYRFGRQFVVFDISGIPAVKICMGSRFFSRKSDNYPYKESQYRLIYWDDGSVWDERDNRGTPPRSMEESEEWIAEAVQQFRQLLAGKSTEFTINFTDGNRFVGKLVKPKRAARCAEGDYYLVVRVKGRAEPLEGWVYGFTPTQEAPDVVQHVTQQYAREGQEVEHVEIKQRKTKKGGQKWSGAFFDPPR